MIKSSQYFTFGGEYSTDYGVWNVNISSGMLEEPFVHSGEISETYIRGRDNPYFNRISKECLSLNLTFAFYETWTDTTLRNFKRWLSPSYYKSLIFSDDPGRIYYCMLNGEPRIFHNANNQGYCEINMKCSSPYVYSPVYISNKDFSSSSPNYFEFNNLGDINCKSIILEITNKNGADDTDISIINLSDGSAEFKFEGIDDEEIITVYNEQKEIETDKESTYRYDDFNNGWLDIPIGINNIKVEGQCLLTLKYEFQFL